MEFAAPKPLQKPKFLSLINPLDPYVWLLVLISYIAAGVVFWVISTVEGKFTNNNFRQVFYLDYAYKTKIGNTNSTFRSIDNLKYNVDLENGVNRKMPFGIRMEHFLESRLLVTLIHQKLLA